MYNIQLLADMEFKKILDSQDFFLTVTSRCYKATV